MSESLWSEVDTYLAGHLLAPDEALDAALKASDAAGLPPIAVSAVQGKLLHLLALTQGARSILEIGTLGGYSTIWLARALPADGRLVTCEYDPKHAEVAGANLARAGVADRVEIKVGRAIDTLATLTGPFDLFFIDADKESNADYFREAVRLSRPGSLILVDNVVRGGAVVDPSNQSPMVAGTRRFFEAVAAEPRVSGTAIQTVGAKGYDGLAVVRVS